VLTVSSVVAGIGLRVYLLLPLLTLVAVYPHELTRVRPNTPYLIPHLLKICRLPLLVRSLRRPLATFRRADDATTRLRYVRLLLPTRVLVTMPSLFPFGGTRVRCHGFPRHFVPLLTVIPKRDEQPSPTH